MRIAAIGSEKFVLGFGLSGVEELYQSVEDVPKLLDRGDLALVLVEKAFFEKLDSKLQIKLLKSKKPIFFVVGGAYHV